MTTSAKTRTTVPLGDLGCGGGGALTVERELAGVPGVLRVYVNALTETAYVEYDATRCSRTDLTSVVHRIGYGGESP